MEPRGQAPRGPSGRSTKGADKTPPTSMKLSSLLQLPAMVEKEEYGKVMSPPLPS